jgi:multiple sugar transport system permease protein
MLHSFDFGQSRRRKGRRVLWMLLRYVIILIALAFFVFPMFWLVSTSIKRPEEYTHSPPIYIPQQPTLNNYNRALNEGLKSLADSLIISIGTTVLTLTIASSVAYSMARFNTGGSDFSFWVLSQRMLPPIAVILPIFILYRTLKLIDTHIGLIMLYTVFNLPFAIWMLRGYFIEIPHEVEEGALVDGASRVQALRYITLPLAASGFSATTVFIFIFSWTEFLFALILSRSAVVTLPVLVARYFGVNTSDWGLASAVSVIASIPIILLSLAVRRHFVRGITMGAIKS